MTKPLKIGSIILAPLNDHHGKISLHFAVVMTSDADIAAGSDLVVAAISTSFLPLPLPANWFPVDSVPVIGHPITGLKEACVVKDVWRDIVRQIDVVEIRGRLQSRIFRQLTPLP